MEGITRNIDRPIKDLMGGVSRFYIFKYVKYTRSQIVLDDQSLIGFPGSDIYKVYSSNTDFTQQTEIDGGAVSWKQNLTIDIPKTEIGSQAHRFVKQNYRVIFQDNNGNWRVLGLYNGLTASYSNGTGSDKSSFSGYSVTFEGQEDMQAVYLDGFDPGTETPQVPDYVFQDGNSFNFQDNRNYIFN